MKRYVVFLSLLIFLVSCAKMGLNTNSPKVKSAEFVVYVYDDATYEPIPGVSVTVFTGLPPVFSSFSNNEGKVYVKINYITTSKFEIKAKKDGYFPFIWKGNYKEIVERRFLIMMHRLRRTEVQK